MIHRRAENINTVRYSQLSVYWRGLIAFLIAAGIFCRFFNLSNHPYWGDELFSLLRVSGHTQAELVQNLLNGKPLLVSGLEAYQSTNAEKNTVDAVLSLAIEDSQHPPFYYILLRFWAEWFGNSITATRSLSVIISLLSLVGIYWLGIELFGSPLVAWVSVALVSVSPFHLINAQEVREYSLWAVMILLSSATLLRAMRTQTRRAWIVYTLASVANLYTFPLSILVALSHGFYVAAREKFRLTESLRACFVSLGIAGLIFLPWLVVMVHFRDRIISTNAWSSYGLPPLELARSYFFNLALTFTTIPDFSVKLSNDADIHLIVLIFISAAAVGGIFISVYSLYFLKSKAPRTVALFLFSLAGVTFLMLFLPDWLFGSRRSIVYRYFTPCYLSLHLAIAYLMVHKLALAKKTLHLWRGLIVGLLFSALINSALHTQIHAGLNYDREPGHPAIAKAINAVPNRVLIGNVNRAKDGAIGTDGSLGVLFSLLHRLEPSTLVQLVVSPAVPEIPTEHPVFLYNPSEEQLVKIRQKYRTTIVQESKQGSLWKLS